jgi:hypothetical protein
MAYVRTQYGRGGRMDSYPTMPCVWCDKKDVKIDMLGAKLLHQTNEALSLLERCVKTESRCTELENDLSNHLTLEQSHVEVCGILCKVRDEAEASLVDGCLSAKGLLKILGSTAPCRHAIKAMRLQDAVQMAQKWMADNVSLGQASPDCGPEPATMFDYEMNGMAYLLASVLVDEEEM